MKKTEDLITVAREAANNTIYGDTEGFTQNQVVGFLNNGLDMLQGAMLRNYSNCSLFDEQFTFYTVAGQREYGLPGTATYAGTPSTARPTNGGNAIRLLEYSDTGNSDDYYSLRRADVHELSNWETTPPSKYAVRGTSLMLSPVPNTTGKLLRCTYPAITRRLDIKRGKIASVTTTPVTAQYLLTIVLAATPTPDAILSDTDYYICVHDAQGNSIWDNIPVASYSSSTRTLTIAASTTYSATLAAGYYITFGKWTTTHSPLPPYMDRYLEKFAEWQMKKIDGSDDEKATGLELSALEEDIVKNQTVSTRDAMWIPQIDWEWLD